MLRRLPLACVLSFWVASSMAQTESQPAILEFIVNGLNQGQQFVRVTDDGDVTVGPELLGELRLKPELWAAHTGPQISLRALVPEIQFSLDQGNATLNLAVPPHWFKKHVIAQAPRVEPPPEAEPIRPRPMAGFLNYSLQISGSEREGMTGMALPLEIGFNRDQWLALTTFNSNYDADTGYGDTLRQYTTALWDDTENLRALSVGDFSAPYGLLQSGGSFGGISLRKNYRLDRIFRYSADLSVETIIESPTRAELHSNGRVADEWDLLPGIVNFADISSYAGSNAELVLTDAFGRERRLPIPTYTSQKVLRKGLHDYAYSFGWQRENLGIESADYGRPALLGYHQYGFADTWTGGASFAATSDAQAAGPTISALIGGFSQLEGGFLLSRDSRDGTGNTATARYGFRHNQFNGYLALGSTSRHFTQVPSTASADTANQPRLQGSLSLNYSHARWGSFGLGYSESNTWNDEVAPNRLMSLMYRQQFGRGWRLNLGFRHDIRNEDNDEIYALLQYSPLSPSSAPYSSVSLYSRRPATGILENFIGVEKTSVRGLGWGYRTDLAERGGEYAANAAGQYMDEHGIYTAAANHSMNQTSGSMGVAGGVAVIDGTLYQGRPVTDSFAVVQVEGIEAVSVESGNAPIGEAGTGRPLLIPDLASYTKNHISIGTAGVPMNSKVDVLNQSVEVKQRSGSVVKFGFSRFSAVDGNLILKTADGEKIVLEALPVELTVNGTQRDVFLGKQGYFYVENLPAGTHVLRVRRAGGDCLATINVPETEKVVVSLGETACVPER